MQMLTTSTFIRLHHKQPRFHINYVGLFPVNAHSASHHSPDLNIPKYTPQHLTVRNTQPPPATLIRFPYEATTIQSLYRARRVIKSIKSQFEAVNTAFILSRTGFPSISPFLSLPTPPFPHHHNQPRTPRAKQHNPSR